MSQGRMVAAVGKETGRALVTLLKKRGANLTDLFVLHEGAAPSNSGWKSFRDLVEPGDGTRLHEIDRLSNNVETIAAARPDFFLMNFSEILPEEILEIPRYGVAGFHYAELPGRRGCNPASWAILHGLSKSCVTLHYYTPEIDRGDIIGVEDFPIGSEDHLSKVNERILDAVVKLTDDHLDGLIDGTAPRKPQEGPGIYTPRLKPEDALIVPGRVTAEHAYRLIKAFAPPFNAAYVMAGQKDAKKPLYITRASLVDLDEKVDSSRILDWEDTTGTSLARIDRGEHYMMTGNGLIRIERAEARI